MKKVDLYISVTAPNIKNGAWLQPVTGGYVLYILDGDWKPLKLVDDNSTASTSDDVVAETTAAVKAEIVGTAEDTSSDMTLNGLKAYVDEQIAGLG